MGTEPRGSRLPSTASRMLSRKPPCGCCSSVPICACDSSMSALARLSASSWTRAVCKCVGGLRRASQAVRDHALGSRVAGGHSPVWPSDRTVLLPIPALAVSCGSPWRSHPPLMWVTGWGDGRGNARACKRACLPSDFFRQPARRLAWHHAVAVLKQFGSSGWSRSSQALATERRLLAAIRTHGVKSIRRLFWKALGKLTKSHLKWWASAWRCG